MKLSLHFVLFTTFLCLKSFSVCEKLGPIPVVDCMKGKLIPTFQEGKRIHKRGGKFFVNGVESPHVSLKQVDTPQLASFGLSGGINGRLGHMRIQGIEWVFICRASEAGVNEETYHFDPVGLIGFNPDTGETCFTDVKANNQPSNESEGDETDYCAGCHANNQPWILTPYLNQSVTGGDGTMDVIPTLPKEKLSKPGWGYKVQGISESLRNKVRAIQPKNPDGTKDSTCTSCHTISTQLTHLLTDSVGKSTDTNKTAFAKKFPQSHWMPMDPFVLSKEDWNQKYGAAFDRLLYCVKNDDLSKCEARKPLILPIADSE